MQAINDLQSLNERKRALVNIPARIAELEVQTTRIRSATADGTPVSGGGSGQEDMLLNNIVERQQLEEDLVLVRKAVKRITGALDSLTPKERRLLQVRYIDSEPGAVSKLAGEYNLDERTVRNKLSEAVRLFSIAMCGRS